MSAASRRPSSRCPGPAPSSESRSGRRAFRVCAAVEIVDARAPSYQELRPLRVDPGGALPSPGFPVYGDLTGVLCGELRHPDDMLANVLSTAAGYAYSDAATEAAMMARAGLA